MEPVQDGEDTKRRIVAVDDDAAVLQLVSEVLRRAGYDVYPASSARPAIELFEAEAGNFDLLLTDVVMPDLTGPVLAKKLRSEHPGLPVLFMSGYHDTQMVQRFTRGEGYSLLPKPFTAEGLLNAVKAILRG
jgi:two-component system cell cycle sensor histidine kinase/response regulator CckA